MNQIVNIAPGSIPAHIAQSQRLNLNAAAHANLAPSFAVVGYKGRNWRLKYRGEDELLQTSPGNDHQGRPLPKTPVPTLSVVIVGMAAAVSKAYYEKRYAEGDDGAPDCFSINGATPDAASPHKQNASCAACQWNKFGSRVTENGKKAKGCPDYRRLAVVPAGDEGNEAFGGPMLLRIPPMSLLNLDRYCRQLEAVGADISQVVTVLGFNLDVAYPEITFAADGWVSDPQSYAAVLEHARGDQVHRMLEEEAVEAPAEEHAPPAAVAGLGARPTHLQEVAPPAAQATTQAPAQPAQPPAALRVSPFAQAAAHQAAPAQATAPAAPAAPTAPTTPATVVQGAPPDMTKAIDELLN